MKTIRKLSFQVRTIVPPNLHQIQPRANWVCNRDEIGFDPNGKCHKVVCNYKFFQREIIWKVQTGGSSTFWCTLSLLTRNGWQCFMPPIVVHQAKDYSQYIHHNIPFEWTVHHTPSGYMDRYGWLKFMAQFSNICGASPVNNQILFFDVNDSHFDDRTLTQMQRKNIQPFIFKAGYSIADQPNDNRPNSKRRLSTTLWRLSGCWSMLPQGFNLTTWTIYWLKHGKPSRYHMETSSRTASLKIIYSPSALPTRKQIHIHM